MTHFQFRVQTALLMDDLVGGGESTPAVWMSLRDKWIQQDPSDTEIVNFIFRILDRYEGILHGDLGWRVDEIHGIFLSEYHCK